MDGNHVEHVDQPTTLRLIACPTLSFEHGKIDRYVPAGATVMEHLRAIGWKPEGLNARVFIDGELIKQARWEYAVPRAGQVFVTRVIPSGAGQGKEAGKIIALIGLLAATWYIAGGGLGAFLPDALGMAFSAGTNAANALGAIVTVGGMLAVTALIPAPLPRRALPLQIPPTVSIDLVVASQPDIPGLFA